MLNGEAEGIIIQEIVGTNGVKALYAGREQAQNFVGIRTRLGKLIVFETAAERAGLSKNEIISSAGLSDKP